MTPAAVYVFQTQQHNGINNGVNGQQRGIMALKNVNLQANFQHINQLSHSLGESNLS